MLLGPSAATTTTTTTTTAVRLLQERPKKRFQLLSRGILVTGVYLGKVVTAMALTYVAIRLILAAPTLDLIFQIHQLVILICNTGLARIFIDRYS